MPNEQQSEVPKQVANVPTPDTLPGVAQTRLLVGAIEATVKDLKDDVKDIKSHRHSDFVFTVSIFAGGFILLAGMLIFGYFKLDDKIHELSNISIRVDTKLEDLLQRIPPIVNPAPRR